MATAGNSQKRVRIVRESTNGTTPAGDMQITPFGSYQMSSGITREQPGNVTSDRQPIDNPAIDVQPTASGTADYIYGQYDGRLEEAFCSTFAAAVTITPGTTFSFDAASNELRDSGNGLGGIAVGRFVKVSGFTEAGNTGTRIAPVLTSAAGALGLDPDWWDGVDEAAGDTVSIIAGANLTPGTSMLTATHEEWNTSSSKGRLMTGVGVSQFQLSVPQPNKCQLQFTFTSMGVETSVSSALANASTAASTNSIINSNTHAFGAIAPTVFGLGLRWDGTLMPAARTKNLTWTFSNPIQVGGQIGTLGPTVVALDGLFESKVALELYRDGASDTETFITDAKNPATQKSLSWGFVDTAGNIILVYLPLMQPMGEQGPGVSQSGFDMTSFELLGRKDSTHGLARYVIWAA